MNKRKLFPRYDEEMATLGVRLPLSILDEIARRAESQVRSRSDVARQLILFALRQDGAVASEEQMRGKPQP